jgi:WD40 repeat protein
VVAGWADGTIELWSIRRGERLASWSAQRGRIVALAAHPDGRRVLFTEISGPAIRVWDVEAGRELPPLAGSAQHEQDSVVGAIAVTADGRRAISGSWDEDTRGEVLLWDLGRGESRRLAGHGGPVRDVTTTPDGQSAVSVGEDGALKVWDLGSGGLVAALTFEDRLTCAAMEAGDTIVAGDQTGGLHRIRIERSVTASHA